MSKQPGRGYLAGLSVVVASAMAALVVSVWLEGGPSAQSLELERRRTVTLPVPSPPVPVEVTSEIHGLIYTTVGGVDRPVPAVTVYSRDTLSNESLRVETDCRGGFVIPPMPAGVYEICWEAPGFTDACGGNLVTLGGRTAFPDIFFLQPEQGAMYGSVSLTGGAPASFRDAELGVDDSAEVTLLESGIPLSTVNVGCNRGFVIAGVPPGSYELEAAYAGETVVVPAVPDGGEIDLVLPNAPPEIGMAYISVGGVPSRRAAPGQLVTVHVEVDDPDADAVSLFFSTEDGSVIEGPGLDAEWTLGSRELQVVSIIAGDGRGGYDRYRLDVSTSPEVIFTGRVLDPMDQPVAQAEVAVNGSVVTTDAAGRFSQTLGQVGERYLMTIRARGYMLFSRVYRDAQIDGTYTLTPAQQFSIDPQQLVEILPGPGSAGLEIPPNSIVDDAGVPASGPLDLFLGTVDLADPRGGMPGDQIGLDTLGQTVALESYGAMSVSIEDAAGNEYNLQPGAQATVTIPIPESKPEAGIPATIPLWIYDESSGVWDEVGQAQHQGDFYVGQVPHFSEINADFTVTNPTCIRLEVETTFPGFDPNDDLLTFPFDVRIEVPSTGDVLTREIDQKTNSIYALPENTNVEVVILDTGGQPIEPTRKSVNTGAYQGCPVDPPHPFLCCTELQLKPEVPPSSGTFLEAYVNVSSDDESVWYASVIDPVVTPGTGTITTAGLMVNGSQSPPATNFLSFFVPGDLIRGTPVPGAGTISSNSDEIIGCNTPPVCSTVFTAEFVTGDIIEVGGRTLVIDDVISDTRMRTVSPFVPAIPPGTPYSHIEVRMVDGIFGNNQLGLDRAFHHPLVNSGYDKIGVRPNLTAWEAVNGFNPPDHQAAYYNGGDLGFGRWMKSKQNANGIFYAVANYGNPGDFKPKPFVDLAYRAAANISDSRFATVVMEYSDPYYGGPPYTKFFVYNNFGRRALKANLDGLGFKGFPRLCAMCHAGRINSIDHRGDLDAKFLPFDLPAFDYSPNAGYTRSAQELAFRELNRGILSTSPSAATKEMIEGSYGGTGLPLTTFFDNWVPTQWSNDPNLYNAVVKKSCRVCHLTQPSPLDWATHGDFDSYGFTISTVVCGTNKSMPASLLTYNNFWLSMNPHQPHVLENAGLTNWNTGSPCQ